MREIKNTAQLDTQKDFLRSALRSGAIDVLDTRRRNLIGIYYFVEDVSYSDLTFLANNTSVQNVSRRIKTGMKTVWEHLPSNLQSKYPLEEVAKGKRVSGSRSPETRKQDAERLKKLWSDPAFKEKALTAPRTADSLAHISEAHRNLWQKGEVHRKKVKEAYQRLEVKALKSANAKKQLEDPGVLARLLEAAHTPEALKKLSDTKRKQWQDPEFKKRMSEAIRRGMRAKRDDHGG